MGEGQYFGEMALLGRIPRTATVTAVETSMLLSLSSDAFSNFLMVVPGAQRKLEEMVRRRNAANLRDAQSALFTDMPNGQLDMLAKECSQDTYNPGAVMMRQGEVCSSLMVITHGTVELAHQRYEGDVSVPVATLGVGYYVVGGGR